MEQSVFTLYDLNKIAACFNLQLVKGDGFFYWSGTTNKMKFLAATQECRIINVHSFEAKEKSQWLTSLHTILDHVIDQFAL